jgi:hypothetical protein
LFILDFRGVLHRAVFRKINITLFSPTGRRTSHINKPFSPPKWNDIDFTYQLRKSMLKSAKSQLCIPTRSKKIILKHPQNGIGLIYQETLIYTVVGLGSIHFGQSDKPVKYKTFIKSDYSCGVDNYASMFAKICNFV